MALTWSTAVVEGIFLAGFCNFENILLNSELLLWKIVQNINYWKMLLRFGNSGIPQKKNLKVNWISRKKRKKILYKKDWFSSVMCVCATANAHANCRGLWSKRICGRFKLTFWKKVNFQCGSLHSMLGIYQATSILHSKISFG